ncbi:hypothetical protein [Flavitalea sp.]|nr:hypothetical protein [Flavitalea sp.]
MNRYLLLRDNKQSGPYSVPELIEKGIKAYDLVWLDGKSAAWRYPSEIEELKAYAPIVEEQPFDRFYKKPAAETHFAEIAMTSRNESKNIQGSSGHAATNAPEIYSTQKIEIPVSSATSGFETANGASARASETTVKTPIESTITRSSEEITRFSEDTISISRPAEGSVTRSPFEPKPQDVAPLHDGQRKIYVTLPGSKTATRPNTEITKSTSPVSQSDKITERPAPAAREDYREEQVFPGRSDGNQSERFTPAPKYKKVDAEYKKAELADTSFSSKFAGADLLTDTVFPGKTKKSILAGKQNAAIMIMGALCLLFGGIIIGLAISNGKKESAKELNNLVKQIQERERLKQLPASQPVAKTDIPANTVPEQVLPATEEQLVSQKLNTSANSQAKLAVSNTVSKKDKKSEEPLVQTVVPDVQPVTIQPVVVQENKSLSNAAAESTRKNIRQLVSVKSNKYKTGVLGGISDLSLTVSNKSDFEIDQVEVEVAYLGPEKRVVKTQTIVFNNIKPGNQLTQEVPRTNRGVSVTTNIKVINSRSLGLVHSGI